VRRFLANTARLGVKELRSLWHDRAMLFLIVYIFSVAVHTAATSMPETLHLAPIAIVDEDDSPLSRQIAGAFRPPEFTIPDRITLAGQDPGLDAGLYTYVLDIPPGFQRDVLAGRSPAVQLNIDATRMSQAFVGSGYIARMVDDEVVDFTRHRRDAAEPPGSLAPRVRFNPALDRSWFGALMEMVGHVTMLSFILTGAALIREREHGTVEHLLVMPVTPAEIMLSKVWSMSAVVLLAVWLSLTLVVRGVLGVPIEGSVGLFLLGTALHLFATSSMGIFMATLARNMPQFAMLLMLTLIPLEMLSGGMTPFESMPAPVRWLMSCMPTSHFTEMSQAILFRGAGIEVVWKPFAALVVIGGVLFTVSLARFRRTLGGMA